MVEVVASSQRRTEYPIVQPGYFAPIRESEGKQWVSSSELSANLIGAQVLADQTERHCGADWAKLNPVKRIVRVAIVEIVETRS